MVNIVNFPTTASDNPDTVLGAAVGAYKSVVVIGYDMNGCLDARASTNLVSKDVLWLVESFKMRLLAGDYSDGKPEDA